MTRCYIAVSQLHLNGWGFILAFEKVCLHYGFRPTIILFFYIYDVHFPPGGYGYISFRARQGRRLFDSYEDSIQEFKWHYFKVLATPRKRAFWLDHENKPFPWVYWNPERNKFTYDLLDVKMKRTKFDNIMARMVDPSMGPRAVLPTGSLSATATAAAAVAASASATAATSIPAAAGSPRVGSSIQVSPAPTASDAKKAKKQPSKRERARVVDLEEELKEDPAADLQRQRKRRKPKIDEAFEKALGDDSAWEHEVDPLRVAFPEDFDYRKDLNAGLTFAPMREALTKMPPEQLLGESYHLHAKSLAYFQVGVETSLAAKIRAEKELSAALDQIEIAQLEEDHKVLKAQFEFSQLSLEMERKRAVAAEGQAGALAASLKTCQADLSKATEASEHWRSEWHTLGSEVTEMCQETLDICLDQVSHLCLGVDFSAITLKSRWDPKSRRIFVPQESEVEGELPSAEKIAPEQDPVVAAQTSHPEAGDAAGGSGECPT
ncbi:hypothetical protein PIB30_025420 [Stylosanthes scabra]|uniref:Transposase (Putative), gypsy type n=1 Tax=Stylosanthes scabra TaxID=79078 RepID=A0ABU6SAD5_9FABA|nr:hypothetical protein [Stylosanthes scabra]